MTPTALELEEGGDSKAFTMQLSSEPLDKVQVNFDISDSTAGTLSATALTFEIWNWDLPQAVKVSPVDDNAVNGDRESYIVFKAATSTDDTYQGLKLTDNIKVCEMTSEGSRME